ncbi:hypothetical protein PENSPDRAFT_691304 [Peniophora sp. CONT]|nr:hypothetical protein PENSPDRAFT_691304 [Peniophora sp. CONT]
MERPSSRQLSLPSRPESGLAEWAEKIKAIQRQVDDDEAEEQRRLEDEIRASRLARKRRSHGVGSRSATPAIVDEPIVEPRSPTRADDEDFRDYASRQRAQADSLTKLYSNTNANANTVSLASFIGGRAGGPRLNKHAPQADAHDASQFEQRSVNASTAPHPIFGRGGVAMPGLAAKGRNFAEPEQPAPAAPSFTDPTPPPPEDKKPRERRVSTSNNALKRYMDHVEKSSPVLKPEPIRTRTFSTPTGPPLRSPTIAVSASSKGEYGRPVTPKTAGFALATPVTQTKPVSRGPSPQPSYAPKPAFVASTPATSPKAPAPAPKPSFTPSAPSLSAPASTPSKPTSPSPTTSPKPAATIPTPSLARPVQPSSKPPPFGPRTPPSINASAAFSRMPTQKDPTPSISRLKGRGFVASIVQASAQLEGGAGEGGGSGGEGGGAGERRGGKRLSTLAERWAPSTESVPASPPAAQTKPTTGFRKSWTPTPSVKPAPAPEPVQRQREPEPQAEWEPPNVRRSSSRPELRKSVSSTSLKKEPLRDHNEDKDDEPRIRKSPSSRSLKHKSSSHSLKHKSSSHSLKNKSSNHSLKDGDGDKERPPSPGGRPMGSSSTMISYIKPMKTGDNDDARSSVSAPSTKAREREEDARSSYSGSGAGARKNYSSSTMSRKARSDVGGVSPGKPLSHLTKDRAKRPKKKGSAVAPTTDNRGKEAPAAQSLVEGTTLATDVHHTSAPTTATAPTYHASTSTPITAPAQSASTPVAPTKRTVADRWASQAVLGVRQPSTTTSTSTSTSTPAKEEKKGMVGARALPGLALPGPGMGAGALKSPGVGGLKSPKSPSVPPKSPGLALRSPSLPQPKSPVVPPKSPSLSFPKAPSPTPPTKVPSPTPPTLPAKDTISSEGSNATPPSTGPAKPPQQPHRSSSRRRERIPSTGSRARVMEVAQMLHEREASLQSEPESTYSPVHSPVTEVPPRREVMVAPPLERRRSSFEAFGSLPVLKEVRTPVGSIAMRGSKGALPVLQDEEPVNVQSTQAAKTVTIKHSDDGPLPPIDVSVLASARLGDRTYRADGILTISVEVLSITGASATALPSTETSTFYDTEILAIVHRFKSKSNGLVNTKVWAWYGRKSNAGELEMSKLSGLARRYGVGLVEVRQGGEGKEVEMVGVLGGRVAVRQGSRTHWSAENTTMHIVRSLSHDGSIVIMDELDLSVNNLCSGYSFCLTLLGSSYVWHGRGSRKEERAVARIYAKVLSSENNEVVELREGEDDDDELFWMMLGEKEYARAEYWRWRSDCEGDVGAKGWRVDDGKFALVETFVEEKALNANVYLLDCFFEMFVMVGKDARSKRADIRLALSAAEVTHHLSSPIPIQSNQTDDGLCKALSRHVSPNRPFTPPVHVLVLPSRIPADLRFHFRDLDENTLNDGDTPDHMNLLTSAEAVEHLQRATWNPKELSDEGMLPLGIHPSDLP